MKSKLDELKAYEASVAPVDHPDLGEWVDGSAALGTTMGHIRAALARINELEADNTKLRAALEAAADAFQTITTVHCNNINAAANKGGPEIFRVRGLIRTFAIEAMRSCWAALGK